MSNIANRPSLLLHICCAACGVYVGQLISSRFKVALFFYNPNIYPESEYNKRLKEIVRLANELKTTLIIGNYDHSSWKESKKGLEASPERGRRCLVCYQDRIEETAVVAKKNNIKYFVTTLTVSPHKDASAIIAISKKIGEKAGLLFLAKDFKKRDGYKKSVALSHEHGLYRQNYCGCEFSMKAIPKCRPGNTKD